MLRIEEFEDGHRPGGTDQKTQLVFNEGKVGVNFVSIFDGLLSGDWSDRAYQYAISRGGRPWGVYVLTSDVCDTLLDPNAMWGSDPERAIGLMSVRALLLERGRGVIGSDLDRIHGTVVWCLASGLSNQVEYHIDYAELYRYETNVIHPPLYAGTCQVSPMKADGSSMKGGDFCVNVAGLDHYRKCGYKGKLMGGQKGLETDLSTSADWLKIPYRRNRGIFHDGDLPHLSTPVSYLETGLRRVILGFNCFTHIVGECCQRAPEHSQASEE